MKIDARSYLFRAIVLATLIIVALVFSINSDDNAHGPGTDKTTTEKIIREDAPKTFGGKLLDDPTAFFTMALAALTAVLAATASGQIYYLRRTDETARIAADAARRAAVAAETAAAVARDTLIASNRAWLKTRVVLGGMPMQYSSEGIDFAIGVSATNIGKEPALFCVPNVWLMTWVVKAGADPYKKLAEYCADVRSRPGEIGHTIFPGESSEIASGLPTPQYVTRLPIEEVEAGLKAASDGKGTPALSLFVGGCFTYSFPSDPHARHQTRFMYELSRSVDAIRIADCPIPASEFVLAPLFHGFASQPD